MWSYLKNKKISLIKIANHEKEIIDRSDRLKRPIDKELDSKEGSPPEAISVDGVEKNILQPIYIKKVFQNEHSNNQKNLTFSWA